VTEVTSTPAPTSAKRRPKDPAATIPLRDGDEGWSVRALAAYALMSEKSFRRHFVKTGLVPLARIGGVDIGSFNKTRDAISDRVAFGDDARTRRQRRGRR
jgi:hypothetical protein